MLHRALVHVELGKRHWCLGISSRSPVSRAIAINRFGDSSSFLAVWPEPTTILRSCADQKPQGGFFHGHTGAKPKQATLYVSGGT